MTPAIVTFVVMTVLDVYASWDPQDVRDQFAVVAASLAGAVLVNAVLDRTWSHWALPRGMMPWAVAMVFALLSVAPALASAHSDEGSINSIVSNNETRPSVAITADGKHSCVWRRSLLFQEAL